MNIKDMVEILFFSGGFYYISQWLYQDKQKKLLLYFYGYCTIAVVSYLAELGTINAVLFLFSPVIIIGFMLMHQTNLQKNMVSLKNITTARQNHNDWLTNIMRLGVTMMHNNKELFLLIEHTDSVASFIRSEYDINALATSEMLFMLVNHVYNPAHMLWIHSDGTVRGVNSQWKHGDSSDWMSDAIIYTAKNDLIIVHIDPRTDTCDLAYAGTVEKEITVDHAHQLIRKKINYPIIANSKGYFYDRAHQQKNGAQHNP